MIKKILPWFVFASLFMLIIIGFATKDKLNQVLSKSIVNNASSETINSGDALIDSLYNYSENSKKYKITLIFFITW